MSAHVPVTEVVILTFHPGTNAEEPVSRLNTIIARQEGFRGLRWGRWEEDANKIQMMINWTDISYHRAFENSGKDYTELFAVLTPILAAEPEVIHLQIDPDAINKVLDGPVSELATFYRIGEGFDGAVSQTLAIGAQSEGCLGYVRGPVVEEIAQGGAEGAKGKGHYAVISWTSLEARVKATEREEVKESGGLVIGSIGGYEVHHVKFQQLS